MRYESAVFEAAYGTFGQLPASDMPEIAFAGRSNVGKSSLINRLLSRKSLARVSSMPGKTITINFYRLPGFRIVDLPGYGYAKVAKNEKKRWAEMMEGYFNSQRNLKLVVQLIDMRHPPSKDDLQMLEYLSRMGYEFFIVLTKSDKLKQRERLERLEAFDRELSFVSEVQRVPFSSQTGEGVEEIKQYLENALNADSE